MTTLEVFLEFSLTGVPLESDSSASCLCFDTIAVPRT